MNHKDTLRKNLEALFITPTYAPIFRKNPKYSIGQFEDFTPYISYRDIVENKIQIRGCPIGSGNTLDAGNRDIMAVYESLDDLIEDGWVLE